MNEYGLEKTGFGCCEKNQKVHCWHAPAKKVSVCQVPKFYRSRAIPFYAGRCCSHDPSEGHDPSSTITTHPIPILGLGTEGLHIEEK